jgi:formylmethanofuran dehydrogenase subunit E
MKHTISGVTILGKARTIEVFFCDVCGKHIDNVMEYRGSLKAEHVCPACFEKHLLGLIGGAASAHQPEEAASELS